VRMARSAKSPSRTSGRVMVLCYHAIADLHGDPLLADFSVPPERFAEQLDTLTAWGWTFVDLDAVLEALKGDHRLPNRALLLTFDDAYADLLSVACPILQERGISAVIFAVACQVGGTNVWDQKVGGTTMDLLSADGLREIAARGVEIGSHTTTHPDLRGVSPEQLHEEVAGSANRLRELGLQRPRAFAYPYGCWDERVARAAREAGYEVAFTVDRGVVRGDTDRYSLPRVSVHAGDTGFKLHLKLATAEWRKGVRDALRHRRSWSLALPGLIKSKSA